MIVFILLNGTGVDLFVIDFDELLLLLIYD